MFKIKMSPQMKIKKSVLNAKPWHYKRECPQLSDNKVLVADGWWDQSDDDEAPKKQDETVTLCLIINDESTSEGSEVNSELYPSNRIIEYLSDDESINTREGLQKAFDKLYEENQLLKENFVRINLSKEKLVKIN